MDHAVTAPSLPVFDPETAKTVSLSSGPVASAGGSTPAYGIGAVQRTDPSVNALASTLDSTGSASYSAIPR
ncbi:hypothetical protein HFX_6333 (plasmid) [Haloferax mediterranei ATCC 33500]|uniref:Uncharacterized protein n=1 Tax=Haloferax mediterranei (strain ATCC 33500 / DSM 1411 / JCM 8866 / NBRC 14739 / NCIMB 2177 / R-4) TaxID=523841 RepID=I3RB45_HALMT|nr:hypothetical protein HFX_6333 [Haloferax mediterranei ATCC 33500]